MQFNDPKQVTAKNMSLCIDTSTMVIDAVDESVRDVFSLMAGAELTRTQQVAPVSPPRSNPDCGVTVVMGLSGGLQGSLALSITTVGAKRWTSALMQCDVGEFDQDVIDAVGELGNILVGGVKGRLSEYGLSISLPTVIRAGLASLVFPTGTRPIQVGYEYQGESIVITIGLRTG